MAGGGIAYAGRNDMRIKIRGEMKDLAALEDDIRDIEGVADAALVDILS